MTLGSEIVDEIVVPGSKMGLGDYVRLPQPGDPEPGRSTGVQALCSSRKRGAWVWWIKVAILCLFLLAGAVVFIIFAGPLLIRKRWLEEWPKKAAIVRLAGEGDWFHQFRAVTLLRISPFPYIVFNYAAVATNVKYFPYICGSLVGTVPEIFLTIYSGRLLRTLADATSRGGFLSVEQALYDALGFGAALAATAAITIYAKRALQTLQAEEELS